MADKKEVKKVEAEEVKKSEGSVYVTAKRKAITSKIGILKPGCVVNQSYFAGGEKTFKSLIDKGFIVLSKS